MTKENAVARRMPPHSIEAEQGVIGCCLQDPDQTVPELMAVMPEEAFYDLRHGVIYAAMRRMFEAGDPIDLLTLKVELTQKGELERVGGLAYLSELVDSVPSALNLPYYAHTVIQRYRLRRVLEKLAEVGKRIYSPAPEEDAASLINEVEDLMMRLASEEMQGRTQGIKELVQGVIERLENYTRGHGQVRGLTTGLSYLDKMLCGLKAGELIVIAARPGMGKTSIGMNIMEHVALRLGQPVGIFSMEMTATALTERLMFQHAEADYQRFRTGFAENADFEPLTAAASKVSASPIYIDDTPGMTITDVRVKARQWAKQYGIQCVLVDYIQKMRSKDPHMQRYQQIAEISGGLKDLAKELEIPVVVLAQLGRGYEKEKGAPRLDHLRESGDIEQDADVVALLHYDKAAADEQAEDWAKQVWPMNLKVAKQRNGPQGDCELVFFKSCMKFKDRGEQKS